MILLDTNVVSELMKQDPGPAVERWFIANADECFLTSVTLGELAFGVARLPMGGRRADLVARLAEWRIRYAQKTLSFDAVAAMRYGELLAARLEAGRPMSIADAQIAAIAASVGARIATRNIRDFAATGIIIVDPWNA